MYPVVDAKLNNFVIKDDGQQQFILNGQEYPTRCVGVKNVRKLVSKNKVKTSGMDISTKSLLRYY
jgi:hypothetical protein